MKSENRTQIKLRNNFFLIGIVVLMGILCFFFKDNSLENQTKELEKPQIKYGRYYNEDKTEFLIISESGNALFYPKEEHKYVGYGVRYYCAPYEFEENILTINIGKAYWKFELKDDVLHCVEYKYAGEVTDIRDENMCYGYDEEVVDIIYGIDYYDQWGRRIVVTEEKICLDLHPASGSDNSIRAPYAIDGDSITMELDGKTALLKFIDGNIYLKEMMFSEYVEYMGDGLEFVPEYEDDGYDWSNEEFLVDRDKYYEEVSELPIPAGHYYNADKTAEIVIGEDGFGKYYPSVDSMVSHNGKWEYDGEILTLTDISSSYTGYGEDGINWSYRVGQCKFKVNGEKISLTEYIDDKGRSKRYAGEQFVFYYGQDELIDKLRPGAYELESSDSGIVKSYSFSSDGKGTVSMYINMHDGEWNWSEDGSGFGTYEQQDDAIKVTFENGDYANLSLKDGRLVLTDYKLGEFPEVKYEELVLEYVGDGFAKIEY